jgi:hypothetical protein
MKEMRTMQGMKGELNKDIEILKKLFSINTECEWYRFPNQKI